MPDLIITNKLDEVPENIRGLCSEKDGVLTLDASKLKTEVDVQNVLTAKAHVNAELSDTRRALSAYKELGELDAIKNALDKNQTASELATKLSTAEKKLAEAQPLLDNYQRLLASQKEAEIRSKVHAVVEALPQPYDRAKVKALSEDYLGKFTLDEKGNLGLVNGQTAEDYLKSRADIFGLHLASKGAPIIENGEAYKKAVDTGDMMAALRNAPKKSK